MIKRRSRNSTGLARRYLAPALAASLAPLLVIAALYDRYSAALLDTMLRSRAESGLGAVAAQLSGFFETQIARLDNITDLPGAAAFLQAPDAAAISPQLADILLLESESPDVYAVELRDPDGRLLLAAPPGGAAARLDPALPFVEHGGAQIIGPSPPRDGRPGWLLVQKPVRLQGRIVGAVALRLRLASLTERLAPLVAPELQVPQLVVTERLRFTADGRAAPAAVPALRSEPFIPGWRIHLIERSAALTQPRQRIRSALLILALISALGLVLLFVQMSRRLSGQLRPLTDSARAISNGDFSRAAPVDAPGELGLLARSFERMRRQLEAMIRSRIEIERRAETGAMAAGIAHEIRNPLAIVGTTLHGLRRGETEPERVELIEAAAEEIARVDAIVDEFLKFARPAAPRTVSLPVREAFRGVQTLTAARLHQAGVALNQSGEASLRIAVDPAHLRQILLNLILNAVEATPPGRPGGGVIALRAHREAGEAVITVSDDGAGMDEATRASMFRPFFTTRASGVGLGLSVTRQLVESNGGRIQVVSAPGAGTSVQLFFPLCAPSPDPGFAPDPAFPPAPSAASRPPSPSCPGTAP